MNYFLNELNLEAWDVSKSKGEGYLLLLLKMKILRFVEPERTHDG